MLVVVRVGTSQACCDSAYPIHPQSHLSSNIYICYLRLYLLIPLAVFPVVV